ncbi:MAG: VTT domain-containing protein [Oceanipulchritudo sp.]
MTLLAIFLGTMASEDLASISAGLLVAAGKLDFFPAVAASFLGILVGDISIYLAGYYLGRPVLRHRWARWFLSARSLDRAQRLFKRHGVLIILATRFLPGTRTATYFSAGALHAPFLKFVCVFALAAAAWTPLLVGLSYSVGSVLLDYHDLYEAFALPALLAAGLFLYLIFHYGIPLFSWEGRRRLRGKWIRAVRWEFWPWWQVNWLVFLYVLYLGFIRYRRPTLFAAANPCMPHGGFLGESKSAILESLQGAGEALPQWRRISGGDPDSRLRAFREAMKDLALGYPVVLKPDEGQRGAGVKVVKSEEEAVRWLESTWSAAILQEFIPGSEYGVFYIRRPSEQKGGIFSITTKEQVTVTGNGRDTLETLIHAHPRAIALLSTFLQRFDEELDRVPGPGEVVPLGELGTHALGAIFRDGGHLRTPELEERMEALARACEGFHFGRFDIKAPDEDAFRAGRDLRILELNGITSEATHIYDPRHGLLHAWGILCRQWRIAFEIGRENVRAGHPVPGLWAFARDNLHALLRQLGNRAS